MQLRVSSSKKIPDRCYAVVTAAAIAVILGADVSGAQTTPTMKKRAEARSFIAGELGYTQFRRDLDPWKLASLSLGRRTKGGVVIGRLNYANRFGISGAQIEADAYPRINATTYAYLNVGYSRSEIFPAWRFGGELFKSLSDAWEGSVGIRQLRFAGAPITLYTGTLGKYAGDYWISARPFLRFTSSGMSASAGVTARRYFADGDHFIGVRTGYGRTPSDAVTPDQLARTSSYSADVHGSGGPWVHTVGTVSLGFNRDRLSPSQLRTSWTGTAGLKFRF